MSILCFLFYQNRFKLKNFNPRITFCVPKFFQRISLDCGNLGTLSAFVLFESEARHVYINLFNFAIEFLLRLYFDTKFIMFIWEMRMIFTIRMSKYAKHWAKMSPPRNATLGEMITRIVFYRFAWLIHAFNLFNSLISWLSIKFPMFWHLIS